MKPLQRLWQDFRQGENIDLIITIAVSIVLIVLELFVDVSDDVIIPLLLAVLALLSITNLVNRYRMETFLEKVKLGPETLLTQFPDNVLYHDMDKAKELMIIGVDLNAVLKSNYARLERKLSNGESIKVLLVNPESAACEMAAMLHYEPMTPEDKRNSIFRSLKLLEQLRQKRSGRLEIRTSRYLPAIGAIVTDLKTPDGAIYLWHYAFKAPDMSRLKLILRHRDGFWYENFREEIIAIWDNGEIWPL